MKTQLTDVTFLLLIRLDSIERFENIVTTIFSINKYFKTNIHVLESDIYNKRLLKFVLKREINYKFIEDPDPILHKTKYFNIMINAVTTKYVCLIDSDIVIDPQPIILAVEKLRANEADISYPYNGLCYNVIDGLRSLYFKKKTLNVLYNNVTKMELLYNYNLVGGIVIANTDMLICSGRENESYYGWGNEDFDRYWRFKKNNYIIYRTDNYLFHLSHPRGINSKYRSNYQKAFSEKEIMKNVSEYMLNKL